MKFLLILIIVSFYSSASAQNDAELFPVNDKKTGYIGYYLEDGTNVVKPQFCSAGYNVAGYYMVTKAEHEFAEDGERTEKHIPNTEKVGLLNSKGEFIIDFNNNYDFIGIGSGIIYVLRNNRYGTVDDRNKTIIPLEYEKLDIQNQEVIIATKNNKSGIITKENEVIIPFIYDEIFGFAEAKTTDNFYVIVSKNGKTGIIDKDHKFIVAMAKRDLQFVTEKSICIKKGNKFSLVDHNLKAILPSDFEVMYLVNIDHSEIYAKDKNYEYYFTIDGKLLKKEKSIEGQKNIID